ncbi:Gfo/Idh/MocA family oxidoreductase [Arthrobacter sp. KFRI-F3372]|uniref:Gfo/Idh/MocA family oxidoreductase n=1 Tax=Pseudarthrobacter oxydans TaxID=1671 RepID=UPI0027A773E3|nr:Gfo/Idh/MocA family oxidoreductase [Actinomycetes bacterium ARC8]WHP59817.1 Gfo/Idh/MocA family oxidoreductase [Arthrobacter sp. KFRI-F3372]
MLPTIIVGAGVAGRELHAAALLRIRPKREVVFIDPLAAPAPNVFSDLDVYSHTGKLSGAVVHVCSPLATHVRVVEQALDLGAAVVLLEKPIAVNKQELEWLQRVIARHPTKAVFPVAVWPHARSYESARKVVERARKHGVADTLRIEMDQHKDRQADYARGRGGSTSAFDVEFPHMSLVARHLLGPVKNIEKATTRPARWAPASRESGACMVRTVHFSGATSELRSELDAPERLRRLRVTSKLDDVTITLPSSRNHPVSTVERIGYPPEHFKEAPLDAFLHAAYSVFEGTREVPLPVSFDEHIDAADLVFTARLMTITSVLQGEP